MILGFCIVVYLFAFIAFSLHLLPRIIGIIKNYFRENRIFFTKVKWSEGVTGTAFFMIQARTIPDAVASGNWPLPSTDNDFRKCYSNNWHGMSGGCSICTIESC
ncbi:MAG: hypothetical protein DYG83_12485 [Candidatus Brocadia sp. AMX2]|nr:MAG: hypothetical protein EDM70_15385 [Candidatus Brocadia sp. AMX2]MBC6933310.1 hypothetical protein [Candidatus Brocadia sp.]MBL1170187.1 hypothetical protein [Candidatus Brocadia sp. AMX1]MCE7867621.1 hypothetical protein [Candidatus Brocadia sp. AMX2]MCQ3918381.1 hypothetical protein [Candidatus Brocadia sp.]